MSADTTEENAAGGDDLRARYLPVSRKELRRRREAELAKQRAAQEAADATTDELAQQEQDEASDESAEELSRAVEDTGAAEALELPAPPQKPQAAQDDEAEPAEAALDEGQPEQQEPHQPAPEAELPEPVEDEQPARPEEEVADGAGAEEPDVALSAEEAAALTAEQDEELDDATAAAAAEDAEGPGEEAAEPEEFIDEQDAPIPASRRAWRLLRETESLPRLDTGLLTAVHQTTGEIAKNDDPHRVDPELLKKQQALAAKAMQANQERMRQQQAESQREERRRSRQRPESEVITGKAVRDSLDEDLQEAEQLTGQIEPVHAQGAHGLDLNDMMDETSRQAGRQSMLLWLVIVLAVLLVGAVLMFLFWP